MWVVGLGRSRFGTIVLACSRQAGDGDDDGGGDGDDDGYNGGDEHDNGEGDDNGAADGDEDDGDHDAAGNKAADGEGAEDAAECPSNNWSIQSPLVSSSMMADWERTRYEE